MLSGCLNMKTTPVAKDVRFVEWFDKNGKIERSYTEMYDGGSWFEAKQINGKWQLTSSGQIAKEQAASVGGGPGGGGGY